MIPDTLVVPLDGSELAARAVGVADALAERIQARILLVAVTDEEHRAQTSSYLDATAGLGTNVPTDVEVVVGGDPVNVISEIVSGAAARIVCMTTHGRGRLRWAVAGSVAEALIRGATRPMLLVGPHGGATWSEPVGQVVACVDGSAVSPGAVGAGCEWAGALGSELTLAFVSHPLDTESATHADEILGGVEATARDAGIPFHTRYVRSSYPVGALLDVAAEPPAALLVMGSHGRTGLARVALGSVTMGVVNLSACPVLVTPSPQETLAP
jgi:nucleotide-binding universal stress UspA family protein